MSRRSPLATVLRVAELRERGARAAVAAATANARAAAAEAARRHEMLPQLHGRMDGVMLSAAHTSASLRAGAAVAADAAAEQAEDGRQAALATWAAAAGRRNAMEELLARHVAEQERQRVAAEQRAMDDRGVRKGGAA